MPRAEEFNPYGLHAIRVPLGVLAYSGLSASAKLLYGRLALFRGRQSNGFCKPRLDTLAQAMGTSTDTVDRWLGELARESFIERRRHGRGVAECIFIAHPVLANAPVAGAGKSTPNSANLRNQSEGSNSADLPSQFRKPKAPNSANPSKKSPHPADTSDSCATESDDQNVHEDIHQEKREETSPGELQVDGEKKLSPGSRPDPGANLREVYRRKTGWEIPRDMEMRLRETCELRGVTLAEFLDALQEHITNRWRNPAGFLTDFARKIKTKRSRPLEEVSVVPQRYAPETGPCISCRGAGYRHFHQDLALREYCECALSRDLQRMAKRKSLDQAQAQSAEPKPADSSEISQPNDNLHSGSPGVRNVS